MNKEHHLKKLDHLYKDWILHGKFNFIPKPMEIEEFIDKNYDQLTDDQNKFLRSLITITAHIQNFEENEND